MIVHTILTSAKTIPLTLSQPPGILLVISKHSFFPGLRAYLSQDEISSLINSCDPKLKPIVLVAITTGMRRGEILSLKWDDVDLKNGFIHVRDSKTGKARSIPIEKPLKTTMKKLPRHIGSEWVFWIGDRGEVRKGIQRAWAKAVSEAEIDNLRFHDLRHHAASTMVMQGVPLYTVKEVLGHASIKTTERYAHLSPEFIRDKIKRVENTGSK